MTPGRCGVVVRGDDALPGGEALLGLDTVTLKVPAASTCGGLTLFHYRGCTRGGPPLHVHACQDEIFVIEMGTYRFRCGDDLHHLEAGDTIFLPRGVPHTFCQDSADGAMIFLFTPAGRMEEFFRAAAAMTGPPSQQVAAALFAAHGMTIVGPPLTPGVAGDGDTVTASLPHSGPGGWARSLSQLGETPRPMLRPAMHQPTRRR